jgi:hypothetical protein
VFYPGWLVAPWRCRVDGYLLALSAVVVPHAALLTYSGCRAFGLLYGRLLDEGLHLAL